jgi:glycosyltransferase involved in cell wall biosynthesis
MSKKLNIVVHDLFNEIGHSRAMIEVLKAMPTGTVDHINFICFTHDKKENILPNFQGTVTFSIVPFPNIKPFIIKSLFFQLYTYLFKNQLKLNDSKTITVGVCSFIGDIVNVQFVHKLWTPLYFKISRPNWYKFIYKKVLLNYLDFCEDIYYKIKRPKIMSLSKFIADDLIERYNYSKSDISVAYSSASLSEFMCLDINRQELYESLLLNYPELKNIDIARPILLFVGAFERKGLGLILDNLTNEQLIVIGKAEQSSNIDLSHYPSITHISFTKEINSFFNLCDCFIFPTSYEPFGLVAIEAAATGTNIIITKDKVGASEILQDARGVVFSNESNIKELIKSQEVLSYENRKSIFESRKKVFERFSWENAAKCWQKMIIS